LVYCGDFTGVTEVDPQQAIFEIGVGADMQLIRYGARRTDA
jgi:hypothetical protein